MFDSAIKDGYESDSQLSFKRRDDVSAPTPQTPSEARSAYSQIQRGGDIPVSGLRMTVPERPKGKCMNFNTMMCYRMKFHEIIRGTEICILNYFNSNNSINILLQ